MGARPNSVPRLRTTSTDPFDAKFQSKGSEGVRRTSVGTSPNMRKASSTTSIVDDLSSIFGASSSSVEFQEVEGESEDSRRARLERHQRILERAEKALAEKNEWDNQTQRDQEERHRISKTLDIEIKRWAAGKEGNLRAHFLRISETLDIEIKRWAAGKEGNLKPEFVIMVAICLCDHLTSRSTGARGATRPRPNF